MFYCVRVALPGEWQWKSRRIQTCLYCGARVVTKRLWSSSLTYRDVFRLTSRLGQFCALNKCTQLLNQRDTAEVTSSTGQPHPPISIVVVSRLTRVSRWPTLNTAATRSSAVFTDSLHLYELQAARQHQQTVPAMAGILKLIKILEMCHSSGIYHSSDQFRKSSWYQKIVDEIRQIMCR